MTVMILNDFSCNEHGVFEEFGRSAKCPECNMPAAKVILKPIRAIGDVAFDFNPHYDEQLGAHFTSLDEKKSFLKKNKMNQRSGLHSPRKSNKTNIICSKDQAKKLVVEE